MGIISAVKSVYRTLKYGKQIGKTAQNGVACYAKTSKGKTVYTHFNTKTKAVVGKKVKFRDSSDLTRTITYDARGNVIASSEQVRTPLNFSLAGHNQYAYEVRNMRNEYNLFGQTTHSSDITLTPLTNMPRAKVLRNVDGQMSLTYLNTLDKNQFTIKCVENA